MNGEWESEREVDILFHSFLMKIGSEYESGIGSDIYKGGIKSYESSL
jgi:hypothetical protein